MAWLICGTVPDPAFPLILDVWSLDGQGCLTGGGRTLDCVRGTPALLAACLQAAAALDIAPPAVLLAGDIGDGDGSARLYARLAAQLAEAGQCPWAGITFHYLFPDADGHNRVLAALEDASPRPVLVADAGFMYAAKMSGYARAYDLFTPDAGELAFLADEKAPHPLYTRGFLGGGADVPALLARCHEHGNDAKYLLVKGSVDRVARDGAVLAEISEPQVPTLEAIGGTGDIVAGLVTAYLAAGLPMERACRAACLAGRRAGDLARPTPATQVAEILPWIPQAVREAAAQSAP